jgi:adenylate cyclase
LISVQTIDAKLIAGYISVKDIYGHPAVLLRIEVPPAIYRQGRLSQISLAAATLGIVAATTLTVAWLLEKYAVSRLAWLSSSVASIAARRGERRR